MYYLDSVPSFGLAHPEKTPLREDRVPTVQNEPCLGRASVQGPVVRVKVARLHFQYPPPSSRQLGPSKYLPGSGGPKPPKCGGGVVGLPGHPLLPSAPGLPRWGLRARSALGGHLGGGRFSGELPSAPSPPPPWAPLLAFVLRTDPRPPLGPLL